MSEDNQEKGDTLDGNSRKGFASNPHLINRKGRPKGSRNKASMKKARDMMDANAAEVVEYMTAILKNDKDFLDTKVDVPMAVRLKAAESLLNKSIANEKDNKALEEMEKKESERDQPDEDQEVDDDEPSFSPKAIQ